MTEQPVTRAELLFLSLGVGLFCGLAVLGSSSPTRPEQAKNSGESDSKEFLSPTTQGRAPLSYEWYGRPGHRSRTLPESKPQEARLY